jgi:WD40 repeat protein
MGRVRRRAPLVLAALGVALLLLGGLAACDTPRVFGPDATPTPTETPIPTDTPGPSPTPDPVQPNDIVYVRRFIFGLSGDLYLVHPSALAARQITTFTRDQPSAASDYPVWSPDRKFIAYASEYRDLYNLAIWNLYKIDPEGAGSQQITGLPQPNNGYFPAAQSNVPGVSIWALMTAPPGLQVHGRVLANGKPVAGAVVVSWLGRGFVQTDQDGNYTLPDVPAGRGWIKATGEPGAGWVWVDPRGSDTAAPDIILDPRLGRGAYTEPAWDARGGMWSLYTQHWFDPTTNAPLYETRLVHISPTDGQATDIYQATSKTLGRPRANPAHPEQVAIVDGTDLLLLTVDLTATEHPIGARRVLRHGVVRNSPVAWAPGGDKLYYVQPGAQDPTTDSLQELDLARGQSREIWVFLPEQQEFSGFDLSPDGQSFVYETKGDLYTRPIDAPAGEPSHHITYFGQASHPTWGGR